MYRIEFIHTFVQSLDDMRKLAFLLFSRIFNYRQNKIPV